MRLLRTATALDPLRRRRVSSPPAADRAAADLLRERRSARPDLDVDVTDSKGKPVTGPQARGLHASRSAERRADRLLLAASTRGRIHAPGSRRRRRPEQILAAYKKGEEAYVPRNFLIYVDLGYLPPGLRNRSLNAIRDLVTRLGPNDAMRVVVFNRSPKVLVDWTTSKETVDGRPLVDRAQGRRHVAPAGPDADDGADRRHGRGPPQRELAADDRAAVRARKSAPRSRTMIDEHAARARHADAPERQEGVPLRLGRLRVPAGLRDVAVRVRATTCRRWPTSTSATSRRA